MTVSLRLFAAALLALQAIAAGAMASHGRAGPAQDAAHLLCSDQAPGAEALALLEDLTALTGLGGGAPDSAHKDCPACALVHAAALPDAGGTAPVLFEAAPAAWIARLEQTGRRRATGPPVGLRAPPRPV